MADGPIRRKSEKAVRDRAGVPVLLFYDETNDKTIMARATDDGKMYTIMGVLDGNGDTLSLSGSSQNNQNRLAVDTENVEGTLESILSELRIMNFHLSNITDMQVTREDLHA
jgi:hypothetical protein